MRPRRRPAYRTGTAAMLTVLVIQTACGGDETGSQQQRDPSPPPLAMSGVADAAARRLLTVGPLDTEPVAQAQPLLEYLTEDPGTREEQHAALVRSIVRNHNLDEVAEAEITRILAGSDVIGQGDVKATHHPMTKATCLARRAEADRLSEADPTCGHPYMVAVPGPGQSAADATVCIDQYEFPNVPCEYPMTWVRANEAAALCEAMGKRLCDAHEWEGACAGELRSPQEEYIWTTERKHATALHNRDREVRWAYGPEQDHSLCATDSQKNEGCMAGAPCGSNTYPAGAFPACVSPFGVYDQHGNAAEHMNLPLREEELGSRGGNGETEMKGSWFIFSKYAAHRDDCRWRAPSWHVSRTRHPGSHMNYHLGFRCCADLR